LKEGWLFWHGLKDERLVVRVCEVVWYVGYVFLRVVLRMLLRRERRNRVMTRLGLHYGLAYNIKYSVQPFIPSYIYEGPVVKILRRVFRKGGTGAFIDVGAYHGHFTSLVRGLLKKGIIISVEADTRNFQVLSSRFPTDDVVKTLHAAVWTEDGEVSFFIGNPDASGFSMTGSVSHTEWHRHGYISGDTVKVRAVRLDTLITKHGLESVDAVKMDIEGAEYHALSDPALDLSKVRNIIVEIHYSYHSRESFEIISNLRRKGFKIIPLYPDPKGSRWHLLACRGVVPW